jgi:excinuclease UvrABC nuclease subunit
MIQASNIDLYSLPLLPLINRSQLPAKAGIYFVLDEYKTPLYIGRSNNIKSRWIGHHRLSELRNISGINIAWLEISDPVLLSDTEAALIEWFNPVLNGKKFKDTAEIRVFVSPELRNQFKGKCVTQGKTMSEVLAEFMSAYVKQDNDKNNTAINT